MKALVIILNDLSLYDDLLEVLVDTKVRGATIFETEGMRKALLESRTLASLFKDIFTVGHEDDDGKSKTILSVIPKDDQLEEVLKNVTKLLSTSKEKAVGFAFTIPIAEVFTFRGNQK